MQTCARAIEESKIEVESIVAISACDELELQLLRLQVRVWKVATCIRAPEGHQGYLYAHTISFMHGHLKKMLLLCS